MKKLAGLVIILAVLILGGYYGMGILAERTIKQNIEVIDQSNGLQAKIEQYDRGLFRSEAKIQWHLHVPERVIKNANGQAQILPPQDYNLEMPLTIYHGPFIFFDKQVRFGLGYAAATFPFPPQYNEQFAAQFTKESTKPQLELSIFINYLNESTVDFKVPPFNLIAKEGNSRFEWLGMDSSTTMSSGMRKVAGKVVLTGLNATKDDSKITLSNAKSDYDLHETSAGIYLGDANFALPSFDIYVKNQKMFEVNNLVVKTDSDIEQHLFNTNLNVTIKSVLANGKDYGPGDLEITLRNLDADVLAKINQQMSTIQNGNDAQRQQAMLAIFPELPKLFNKGAEFELSKFSLKIPQGQMEGNLYVTLPKGEDTNPFELMQKVQGRAKLQIPQAAVKQVMQQSIAQQLEQKPDLQQTLIQQLRTNPANNQASQPAPTVDQLAAMQTEKQLTALQQAGLVMVQGNDYVIELNLDHGKFIVNGKPFDPSMIKFQ